MVNEIEYDLDGQRILVVEDEVIIAMLIEDFVEELGGEIVGPVGSASGAVKLIESEDIGAATLDVNIADGSVYDAAAALRSRAIPFVFVTGYSDLPDCPQEFLDAPRLKKPFTLDQLARVLSQSVGAS